MYTRLHVSTRYSCHILNNYFFDIFSKKTAQISDFMKILPLATELFHANGKTEGRTDRQTWRSWYWRKKLFYVSREILLSFIWSPCPSRLHTTSAYPSITVLHLLTEECRPSQYLYLSCARSIETVKRRTCNHAPAVIRTHNLSLWTNLAQ